MNSESTDRDVHQAVNTLGWLELRGSCLKLVRRNEQHLLRTT